MPTTFTMPKLSPTMTEGTIVKWHKREGDFVEAGDLLLEVATDKATVEHNALDEGYLRQILVKEQGAAVVNQPIALFTETKDESLEGYVVPQLPQEMPAETAEVAETAVGPAEPQSAPKRVVGEPTFTPYPPLESYSFPLRDPSEERVIASPLAKRLAEERGLDLRTVKGSGPGGRIVERDLDHAQRRSPLGFDRQSFPTSMPGTFKEEPLTPMRKAIGQRLQQSKSFIPHFYVTQEVDAEPLMAIKKQLQSVDVKLSYNDLIVRATAIALRSHPVINSGFDSQNGAIIRYATIDVCVAVSIEGGLITPIIRHADYKSCGMIGAEVRELAKRAKEGKLRPEEYQGGSFTVSNLGMFGVSDFVAVINPPQAAILAVSGIIAKPVVREGSVVAGHTVRLTLSADHRVIDGLDAAKFLSDLSKLLENPAALLLD